MKRIVLIVLASMSMMQMSAQDCLPEGINFYSQQAIDSFSINYPNCSRIGGMVSIIDTIEGDITSLLGLSNISSIGGGLTILQNDSLKTLTGLDNLDSVGHNLIIRENHSLANMANLADLDYVGAVIIIQENASLLNLEGLDNLDTITVLNIIGNSSLENLHNLSNLKRINGEFLIENNQALSDLTGLENLISTHEDIKIFNNDLLTDLQGLNNLNHITSFLKIRYNDLLISLDGLENLDTMGSGLSINDNPLLSSLAGIDDSYIHSWVGIFNNPMLAVCNINSICAFLLNHSENAEIHDNAPGCNGVEEVENKCLLSVEEIDCAGTLNIFPNPTLKEINMAGIDPVKIDCIEIFNLLNQKVLIEKRKSKIDVSKLERGIYLLKISSQGKVYRNKFIKR